MGLSLNLVVHPQLCHTSHYMKNLFLFAVSSSTNNCALNLNQSYQCHRLQILQQDSRVANNHKLWTKNPLGLFPQYQIYLVLAMLAKA